MSRVYNMSRTQREMETLVAEGEAPGLSLVFQPESSTGAYDRDIERENGVKGISLWPVGVTDGTNYGWFEGCFILFWGRNNEMPILDAFSKARVNVRSSF